MQAPPNAIPCATLGWHPTSPYLVVFWQDGGMTGWRPQRGIVCEEGPDRLAKATTMAWSKTQSPREQGRFVVGDVNGQVVVCVLDDRDKVSAIRRIIRQSPISHIAFRYVHDRMNDSIYRVVSTSTPIDHHGFFFATHAGTVFHVSSAGVVSDTASLGCPTASLQYSPSTCMLYAVGVDAGFMKIKINQDGRVVDERKAKLGGITVTSKLSNAPGVTDLRCTWVGDAVLAAVTNSGRLLG